MNDSGVPATVIKEMIKANQKPASAGISYPSGTVANNHAKKRA